MRVLIVFPHPALHYCLLHLQFLICIIRHIHKIAKSTTIGCVMYIHLSVLLSTWNIGSQWMDYYDL